MKAKVLSTNKNSLTMFRLGAMEVALIENNFDKEFEKSIRDEELAILVITKEIYARNSKKIDNYRQDNSKPLIVIIDG